MNNDKRRSGAHFVTGDIQKGGQPLSSHKGFRSAKVADAPGGARMTNAEVLANWGDASDLLASFDTEESHD